MPITDPASQEFADIGDLRMTLTEEGCRACDLGFQEGLNGVCVARGLASSRRMIIGEAPGKHEDAQSEPFVGPAGQLLNKVLESVGFNPDTDFYVTNVVLCRPIAPKGSGKENYTPRMVQRRRCRPFLEQQIGLIQPRIIVTLGKPATEAILGVSGIRMGDYRGKMQRNVAILQHSEEGTLIGRPYVFPMLHPAAILHARSQPEKHQLYREQTWEDIKHLKQFIEENDL